MDTVQMIHMMTEPTRFRLLVLLFKHHYCVKALAKSLGISEPAVSQHLQILKKVELVQGIKIGYQMHYQVNKEKIQGLLKDLLQQFEQFPNEDRLTKDMRCSCEYVFECIKKDVKFSEEQDNGRK